MPVYSGELQSDPDNQGLSTFGPSTIDERIGAIARDTFAPDHVLGGILGVESLSLSSGIVGGEMTMQSMSDKDYDELTRPPQISMEDAKAKRKAAGLDQMLKLPEGETMSAPALAIMLERAQAERSRAEVRARGPGGVMPSALDFGTSLVMGALDPLNDALAMIPVVGEARYGKLMASAGQSILARAGVRAGLGALQGAEFSTALAPLQYFAKTQEGQDYTFADALYSILSGAGQFSALHVAGGGVPDLWRRVQGRPFDIAGETHGGTAPGATAAPGGAIAPGSVESGAPAAPGASDAGAIPAARSAAGEAAPQSGAPGQGVAPRIDNSHDVVSGANSSKEPNGPVYIDRRIPELSPLLKDANGQPANLWKYLAIHEEREAEAMRSGLSYEEAHAKEATPAERAAVEADGVDWKGYTDEIDGYLAKIEHEKAENPPPDTHVDPQAAIGDHRSSNKTAPAAPSDDELLTQAHALLARANAVGDPVGAMIADLPERAKEDLLRGAIAQLTRGEKVTSADLLHIAGKVDPRLAAAADPDRAVYHDVAQKLELAGVPAQEAAYHAALWEARYRARAAALNDGRSALDLYRAEEPEIRRAAEAAPAGRSYQQTKEPGLFAEREAEGQTVLPGAERIGEGELAQRRADQPLKPKVAQKPMEEGLFGDSAAQKSFLQSQPRAPVYYSAVARALDALKQDKAPPAQWLATLKNAPGVKAEELQWLGLGDWLKQQKGQVSKQAIADYIRANQIDVQEVEHGHALPLAERERLADQHTEAFNRAREAHERFAEASAAGQPRSEVQRLADESNRLWTIATDIGGRLDKGVAGPETKFGSYTLPGGENYRELLLTLPQKAPEIPKPELITELPEGYHVTRDAMAPADKRYGIIPPGQVHARSLVGWHPTPEEATRQALNHINATEAQKYNQAVYDAQTGGQFRSSHWDEPNVLAHIRFNDRVIGGKKTLFLEEIQSDWHQAGKRKGYGLKITPEAEALMAEIRKLGIKAEPNDISPKMITDAGGDYELSTKWWDLVHARSVVVSHGVPDAPFKTTWPELSLKRMIRYAAEHGYDKIAWTPGEVQAARYDLSRQIKTLHFDREPDRTYAIDVETQREGATRSIGRKIPEDKLADYLGKEMAEKIAAHEKPNGSFTGLDLKVGGEGMLGFYDDILPAAAKKLTKKFGGKVEQERLKAGPDRLPDDMPEDYVDDETWRAKHPGAELSVHALDITPALRQAAVEHGFPLFQGGEAGPRGRITFDNDKAVIELFKSADRSTFLHESGHLWLEELIRDASGETAPVKLKDDLKTVLDWLGVAKPEDIGVAQHEQWAQGFEQYLMEGHAPSPALEGAFAAFKRWLMEIYKSLARLGAPLSRDVRGVMDRMLATEDELAAQHVPLGKVSEEDWNSLAAERPPYLERDAIAAEKDAAALPLPASALPEPIEDVTSTRPAAPAARGTAPAGDAVTVAVIKRKPSGPRARPEETWSLLEFLASRGGLSLDKEHLAGDLKATFDRNPFIPGFGPLFRKTGMTLDKARETAVEAGYMFDPAEHKGTVTESTINELLDLLREEAHGNKQYRFGIEPVSKVDPAQLAHEMHTALDKALGDVDIDPASVAGTLRDRVLQIMAKEHVADPLVAYERAVMEEDHRGVEAGKLEPRSETIGGWDTVHDDAGAAPGASGGTAQERRPGGGDAGATARAAGAGDREAADQRPAKPSPRLAAAEEAAAEAKAQWDDLAGSLSEAERATFDEHFAQLDQDVADRAEILRQGAACLAGAAA